MNFQICPIPSSNFEHLYNKTDAELESLGAKAITAKNKPGYPCRVSLRDAEPGERLILLNYEHLSSNTPYRASHAIFVIDGANDANLDINEIPEAFSERLLSIRAFNREDMMVAADVIEGKLAGPYMKDILENHEIDYLHIHNAKPGCFAARVTRSY